MKQLVDKLPVLHAMYDAAEIKVKRLSDIVSRNVSFTFFTWSSVN